MWSMMRKNIVSKSKRLLSAALFLFLTLFQSSVFAFTAYSNADLDELEKEFVMLINRSGSVIRDPLANEYINHLGRRLASSAKMHSPLFFIVRSEEINAFAGPGGYIGINSQLILSSDEENELASVMAHELAHVRQHHLYFMIEHQKQMKIPMLASILAAIALGAVNPTLGSGALMASLTGFAQDNINFIRSNEKEADAIGIDMLKKSGYDPRGMIAFFKKMEQQSRYYYSENIPAILRTHPLDKDRIAEAENRLGKRPVNKNNSPYYPLFKERIRILASNDLKRMEDFYKAKCNNTTTVDACRYGHALLEMELNHYANAKNILETLQNGQPDNLYYQISLARANSALKNHEESLRQLDKLYLNYSNHYAIILSYASALSSSGQNKKAVDILIKGQRKFRYDLGLCRQLARAFSNAGEKGEAYFTQAQCFIIEGRRKAALQQLSVAEKHNKKDSDFQARVSAYKDEIKSY